MIITSGKMIEQISLVGLCFAGILSAALLADVPRAFAEPAISNMRNYTSRPLPTTGQGRIAIPKYPFRALSADRSGLPFYTQMPLKPSIGGPGAKNGGARVKLYRKFRGSYLSKVWMQRKKRNPPK